MLCAIHQPNFFPWLGYFEKIVRADAFVFLNAVDYEKSGHSMQCYTNRVSILDKDGGKKYIHCPVIREHGPQRINTVRVKEETKWKVDVRRELDLSYANAPHKEEVDCVVDDILAYETEYLADFNIFTIETICKKMGIGKRFYRQELFDIHSHSTELFAELTRLTGCNEYLYGGGGNKYQEVEVFEKNGIKAIPQCFKPIPYMQGENGEFISGLSILDILYWQGFDATRIYLLNCSN